MNRNRIFILAAATLSATLWAYACGDGTTDPPPPPSDPPRPTTVTVSPATAELAALDATVQLSAEVRDQNGQVMAGVTVAWASDNAPVATVDGSGLVTAAGNGTATITATAGSVSGSATVSVAQRVSAVAVSPATDTLVTGDTLRLGAEATDANGHAVAEAEFSWASSDTSVAVVEDAGLVTAAGVGETTITATSGDASGDAVVTVMQSAGSVIVSPAADTIVPGDTLQLVAEAFDANGHRVEDAEFDWSSSAVSVARVDGTGLVTGVAEGTATITATTANARGTAEITVQNPDRAALLALYNATDGPNWVNNKNWLTDAPLGEWYGVETDVSGRVVRLDLGGRWDEDSRQWILHGLTGPLPPELGNLGSLTVLELGSNALSGSIPPQLGDLVNLRRLDLGRNALSGRIPPQLGNLASLGNLRLDNNDLTGSIPPELGTLAQLTSLQLGNNSLGGQIPPELGTLANLRNLRLMFNNLTGAIPPELGDLSNLAQMWLAGNNLSGSTPRGIGDLANLESLRVDFNSLAGPIPPELGNLPNLRELGIERNSLSGSIPPELGQLAQLGYMVLNFNRLTGPIPPELGQLDSLRVLHLGWNQLTGPVPSELGQLLNLTELMLRHNELLVGALPESLTALEALDWLFFDGTGLCAPATTGFQLWLQGVEHVFGENRCPHGAEGDRSALGAIYQWTNGDGWKNNENWLGDGSLNEWYGVTTDTAGRVTRLELSGNNLSGILPAEAGDLVYLEDLTLSENVALDGELPLRMLQLTFLSTLRLDDTNLCVSRARVFREWLAPIKDARVAQCPDDHGNEADSATAISLGGRTDGQLESYRDEDWFRMEIGERGTLTLKTEGNTNVVGELISTEGELLGYHYGRQIFLVRHVPPGPLFVRVKGSNDEIRGSYTLLSSFEPPTPGARAYLTQATQSHDFAVPLVAKEDALLRVFVMADSGVVASMPPVQATFYRDDASTHSVLIGGSSTHVPWKMAESDLDATANAVIPGSVLIPGTEMVVEIDPDGTTDPSLGIAARIPAEGRTALDIRALPDFHVTAVPLLSTDNPDSSGYRVAAELTAEHELFYETQDWLPVSEFRVSVREPVLVDYDPSEGDGLTRTLADVELVYLADRASGYYMGVIPWTQTGVFGRAQISGNIGVSRMDGHTIAHEFGHNLSLQHAPCGNPAGVDGRYPHIGGRIGRWGYDFRTRTLVDPQTFTDLMTYCRVNDWISDYSFTKALEHRDETQAAAEVGSRGPVLIVRGGVAERELRLEPAFVLDVPPALPEKTGVYRLVGLTADGGELFGLSFGMQQVADDEDESAAGFTFAIPTQAAWGDALAAITLTGPEGSVELLADDSTRLATMLVLDQETRRIRAILRESPEQLPIAGLVPYVPPSVVDRAAAGAGVARASGIEVLFSRGIPGKEAWRR
ncbi:MAG: Ig-like domain-containing protein [Gemmatimonadota bacterium]|nr:Ig-like domain-containing protein [Gemmatimonadota bacterium]